MGKVKGNFVWEDDGRWFVSGYASKFDNVDLHGDVIVKGAFAETIDPAFRNKHNLPSIRFLVEHKHDGDPIGAIRHIEETDNGLYFEAELLNTIKGVDVLEEFKLMARDCFSVGIYATDSQVIPTASAALEGIDVGRWKGKEVNIIKKAELVEISAVLLPANTQARLGVKNMSKFVKKEEGDEEAGTGSIVGSKVQFYDGDDAFYGIVVEEYDEPVETDAGVIEPVEGDPVLAIDILLETEDGEEQTGDIVYAHRSSVTVVEDEEMDTGTDEEEEDPEEKSASRKPRFIAPRKAKAAKAAKPKATPRARVKSDDFGRQFESIKHAINDGVAGIDVKVSKLSGEIDKLKSRQRPSGAVAKNGVGMGNVKIKSAVAEFFGNTGIRESLKSHSSGDRVKTAKLNIKSFYKRKSDIDMAVTVGNQSALAGLSIDRSLGIVEPAQAPLLLRDLMNVVKTDKASIEYVQESGFANLAAVLTVQLGVGATTVKLDSARGFYAGQTITLSPDKNTIREDVVVDSVNFGTNELTLVDGPVNTHAAKAYVFADRFTFTPETEVKPRASLLFAPKTAAIKTLAHWIPATKQSLADLDQLQAYIERRLISGLKQVEEYQILFGDGSADQLLGIMVTPGIHEYDWADGAVTDSKVDALRRAITLASYSNYPPDVIVMSIKDWEDVEINKGTDGHYIQTDITSGLTRTLWGCRVFVTNSMPADRALVGSFALGATLWDREDATIHISDSHDDFFTRNMIAILAEERIGLTVERPEAFVSVDLSAAPVEPVVPPVGG